MKTSLEDQIRDFAHFYAESLPEVDIDEIRIPETERQRVPGLEKPEPETAGAAARSVGRGLLVAMGTALAVLILALTSALLSRTNEAPGSDTSVADTSETPTSAPGDTQDNSSLALTWTKIPVPDDFRIHSIVTVDGRFFGLARDELESDDPHTRLWVSEDGTDWKATEVDASRFGMRAAYFQQLVQVGDALVGVVKGDSLESGAITFDLVASSDGITWDPVEIGEGEPLVAAIAGGPSGGIVLTRPNDGSFDTYEVWWSTDGNTWTHTSTETFTGVSGPALASVGDSFYVGANEWVADGESQPAVWESADASEWKRVEFAYVGTDWSGWLIPADAGGQVLLSTGNSSGSQMWLLTGSTTWTDVTPADYSGGSFVAHSQDPLLIVDPGGSGGPEDPEMYTPPILWSSISGTEWKRHDVADTIESEGTIGLVAAKDQTVVMIYRSHPEGQTSIWVANPNS